MSRVARTSLAATFAPSATSPARSAPPDRAGALAGLLPERPQPAAAGLDHQPQHPADTDGAADIDSQDVPDRERTTPRDLDRVRNVAIYLPLDLLERLRATARSREMTYAEVLSEAADAHLEAVAGTFTPQPQPAAGGGMPTRTRRRTLEPGIQRQLRLDGHQLAWLDAQAKRLQAPSRNALIVSLLRAHLSS